MTTNSSDTPVPTTQAAAVPLPELFTAAEMDALVRSGRAYQWDIPLQGEMPLVSLVDGVWLETEDGWTLQAGAWYSVFTDRHDGAYERVDDEAAAVYTDFYARLRISDQIIAPLVAGDDEPIQDSGVTDYPNALEPLEPDGRQTP